MANKREVVCPSKCETCNRRFKDKEALYIHSKVHINLENLTEEERQRPFACDTCGRRFKRLQQMTDHAKTHTDDKPYECKLCQLRFYRPCDLKRHHRGGPCLKPFTCQDCEKTFKSEEKLRIHRRIHPTGEKPFKCQFCQKSFAYSNKLESHLRIHTLEKPFPCDECGKRFGYKAALELHKHLHRGVKKHCCEKCTRSFYTWGQLTEHMKIHSDVRPFECEICHKKFRRNFNLKNHMVTHTKVKEFLCETCSKSFSTHSALIRHDKLHTGEKLFTCDHCSRLFNRMENLTQHVRTQHSGAKNCCPICQRNFPSRSALRAHKKEHVGLKKVEKRLEKDTVDEIGANSELQGNESRHFVDKSSQSPGHAAITSNGASNRRVETTARLPTTTAGAGGVVELLPGVGAAEPAGTSLQVAYLPAGTVLGIARQNVALPVSTLTAGEICYVITDSSATYFEEVYMTDDRGVLVESANPNNQPMHAEGLSTVVENELIIESSPADLTVREVQLEHQEQASSSQKIEAEAGHQDVQLAEEAPFSENHAESHADQLPREAKEPEDVSKQIPSEDQAEGTDQKTDVKKFKQGPVILHDQESEVSHAEETILSNSDDLHSLDKKEDLKDHQLTFEDTDEATLSGQDDDVADDIIEAMDEVMIKVEESPSEEFDPDNLEISNKDGFGSVFGQPKRARKRNAVSPEASPSEHHGGRALVDDMAADGPLSKSKKTKPAGGRRSKTALSVCFSCKKCGKSSFTTSLKLRQHMRRHCPASNFEDESSKPHDQLDGIQKDKVTARLHPCPQCPKIFQKSSHFKQHLDSVHLNLRPYICELCSRSFSQKATLDRHQRMHKGERPFKCDICERSFSRKEYLATHVKRAHPPNTTSVAVSNPNEVSAKSAASGRHVGKRPIHPCESCSMVFNYPSTLHRHRQEKHNKNAANAAKPIDLQPSSAAAEAGRQEKESKPYRCDTCGRAFGSYQTLVVHMRVHSGEKPFVCDKCDKRFRQRAGLMRHLATHEDEKPFKCGLCQRQFALACYLTEHLFTHANRKMFNCKDCDKGFSSRSALSKHKKIHLS